jgi:DNA-binding response OmpR family regulator
VVLLVILRALTESMTKILVVDDDKNLCSVLHASLEQDNYLVEIAHDGVDALQRLQLYAYDLVILDWDLPLMNGIDICRKMRASGGQAPVLMLTGKSDISQKEKGFETGVDDYLTKPFELKELKMRVKALLRRPATRQEESMNLGGLLLKPGEHKVIRDGNELQLSPKEFGLLEHLMRRPNEVCSADHLLKAVWTMDEIAGPEVIRQHLKNLRSKIDVAGQPSLIQTVFGVGYKFVPVQSGLIERDKEKSPAKDTT